MSGIINPFNNVHFVKWKNYVESIGGNAFGAVVLNDQFSTRGDKKLVTKYLAEDEVKERRESKSWVPAAPLPKLPTNLCDLMDYKMFDEVKRTATTFLKHFLLPGQLLGEVS